MSLKIKKKAGQSVPPLAPGTYPAVCVGIVDLGEQYSQGFKKCSNKLLIIWEIPSQTIEIDEEEKPRWLSKEFTASLHEKSALHQTLLSWRGRAFTEEELSEDENGFLRFSTVEMLGTGCLLQVIVEEKEGGSYNRITSVVALPAGMDPPAPQNPLLSFDIDQWDQQTFEALPAWIQQRIQKSTQFQKLHAPADTVDVKLEQGEENPI